MIQEYRDLETLAEFDIAYSVRASSSLDFALIGTLTVRPSLLEEIVKAQGWDRFSCQTVDDLIVDDIDQCPSDWTVGTDGGLRFQGRLYVPNTTDLRSFYK